MEIIAVAILVAQTDVVITDAIRVVQIDFGIIGVAVHAIFLRDIRMEQDAGVILTRLCTVY